MFFKGDYGFFDYKYDIPGYSGQDFGGAPQLIYFAVSVVLTAAALFMLRKISREKARRIIGFVGIFLTVMYVGKMGWESFYDISRGHGFNFYLLPLDTCSLIMPAAIIAGFGKGRLGDAAECWTATGGIVGGLSNMIVLNALNYYPFFTFGAFYSMTWHLLMVFSGLLALMKMPLNLHFTTVKRGFAFHLLMSVPIITADYIFDFDFMLYRRMSGIPVLGDIADDLIGMGLGFLNPFIMTAVYFTAFSVVWLAAALLRNRPEYETAGAPPRHGACGRPGET